jgi:hypothetical protein
MMEGVNPIITTVTTSMKGIGATEIDIMINNTTTTVPKRSIMMNLNALK